MKRKNNICYLCGQISAEQLTRDHAIPQCLFLEPLPKNLITNPCCRKCQKSYEKDEEYFRNNIALIVKQANNKTVSSIFEKAHRSFLRRPKLYYDLKRRLFPVNLRTPTGIFLGKRTGIKIPIERTNRVYEKIALGLHFHHTGERVPDDFERDVYFNPDFQDDIIDPLVQHATYIGDYPNTFLYMGTLSDKTKTSFWLMSFYESVAAAVAFHAPYLDTEEGEAFGKDACDENKYAKQIV